MKKDKDTKIEESKAKEKAGFKNLVPYFGLLRPYWLSFLGSPLLCGVVYGIASGFGLPTMIDQIFPKIFPSQANSSPPPVSFWQLFLYVSVFPAVFLIRGLSGYFNTYLINYCGVRVLEKVRIKVFRKLQRLPLPFTTKIRKETC